MTTSSRREQIRAFLQACAAQGHYSPTLREIGDAVGLSAASAVQHHTNALIAEGFCERTAKGRLRLQRCEPVLTLTFQATDWGDEGHVYLPQGSFTELKDGQMYRVEVYRAE